MSDADLMPPWETDCSFCHGIGYFFEANHMKLAFRCSCRAGSIAPGSWQLHQMRHAQRIVRSHGRVAWVDRQLAPLIQKAWDEQMWTAYSCQGDAKNDIQHARAQGHLILIDRAHANRLLELWDWQLPGLCYLDYELRPTARWEGTIRIRFSSITGLSLTRNAIRRGVFQEAAN